VNARDALHLLATEWVGLDPVRFPEAAAVDTLRAVLREAEQVAADRVLRHSPRVVRLGAAIDGRPPDTR
jgi:hypothetical protein